METSDSGANHAVLHAQSRRLGLGHMETCNSGAKVPIMNARNHR